jgi:NodT family efflux transporter outer membrane factor (OMF) lipoprotein
MKIILPTLFCLTILLSACEVGPDFKTPTPPTVTAYTAKDETLSTEQHIVLGLQVQNEWWTLFSSPALNDTIKQALASNYDMTTAKERLGEANESVRAERGNLLPQVSLGAVAGNQLYGVALFGPVNFQIPAFTYYELGPSLSWTPDLFGGTRRSIEQQQALADYETQQLNATYITVTGNVVALSLTLAATKAELDAISQIIDADKNNLQLTQKAFQAGANSKMDILNAERQLENDEALMPPLQQQLSVSRHALAILLGKTPADWTPPDFTLNDFALPQNLPLSLPSELVRKRPDILAAEANLHAASAAIGIATANLYPSLTISGNVLQEALTPAALFESNSTAWSAVGGLTAPIFSGGTLSAQKRAAVHAYQAALAQYQQTILHAFAEVANSLSALQHDDATLNAQQRAFNSAEASLLLTQKSYRAGDTGLMQIHEAERQLAAAKHSLVLAQSQRFLDTAQLFVALGGSPVSPS